MHLQSTSPLAGFDSFAVVVAQVFCTFGATDVFDPLTVQREAGFCDEDFLLDVDAYRILLEQGYNIVEYTTFRQEYLVRDGLHYLKHYYGAAWDEQCDRYFNPELVSIMQERAQRFIAAVRASPPYSYARVSVGLHKMELLAAMGRRQAVSLVLKHSNDILAPALIAPPADDDENTTGWVYDPTTSSYVSRLQLNSLWSRVVPSHGAALIKPRPAASG